jgi:hypothetical protein
MVREWLLVLAIVILCGFVVWFLIGRDNAIHPQDNISQFGSFLTQSVFRHQD